MCGIAVTAHFKYTQGSYLEITRIRLCLGYAPVFPSVVTKWLQNKNISCCSTAGLWGLEQGRGLWWRLRVALCVELWWTENVLLLVIKSAAYKWWCLQSYHNNRCYSEKMAVWSLPLQLWPINMAAITGGGRLWTHPGGWHSHRDKPSTSSSVKHLFSFSPVASHGSE